MALGKGHLYRVKRLAAQTLDGGDAAAIGLPGQHGASLHALPVDQDGTAATLTGVTADMGAGEAELFAQHLDQQGATFNLEALGLAIYFNRNVQSGSRKIRRDSGELAQRLLAHHFGQMRAIPSGRMDVFEQIGVVECGDR